FSDNKVCSSPLWHPRLAQYAFKDTPIFQISITSSSQMRDNTQICEALLYLHEQFPPIIHRDIKPANIKIRPDNRAMLVDFGIAKVYDPKLATTLGAKAVTPGYSPQEQYLSTSRTDARTDIYALGATIYTLLTGEIPPESPDRGMGIDLENPKSKNYKISGNIDAVIIKCLEIHPDNRYQSITELKEALINRNAATETLSISKVEISPTQKVFQREAEIKSDVRELASAAIRTPRNIVIGVGSVICLLIIIFLMRSIYTNPTVTLTPSTTRTEKAKIVQTTTLPPPTETETVTPSPSATPTTPILLPGQFSLKSVNEILVMENYMTRTGYWDVDFSWSSDNTMIALVYYGYNFNHPEGENNVHIYNIETGEKITELIGHTVGIAAVDWSNDGSMIATVDLEGKIIIWDATNGDELKTQSIAEGWPTAIDWSPNDESVAITGCSYSLYVWDVFDSEPYALQDDQGDHCNFMWDVRWSHSGRYIAIAGGGEPDYANIVIWDAETKTIVMEENFDNSNSASFVSWSYDDHLVGLIDGGNNLKVLVALTGKLKWEQSNYYLAAWSPISDILVASRTSEFEFYFGNDPLEPTILDTKTKDYKITNLEWSPDGSMIAIFKEVDGELRIYRLIPG
ncbi:MAG: serine/threonine-protein kinase, partial [Chloroflexota bacterium]